PEVVLGRPIAGERLRRRQLHTLRSIGDEFLGRPTSRSNATTKVVDGLLLEVHRERLEGCVVDNRDGIDRRSVLIHPSLLLGPLRPNQLARGAGGRPSLQGHCLLAHPATRTRTGISSSRT